MKNFFEELLDYNFEMNNRLIKVISENNEKLPEKVMFLLSHIHNAHHIWNCRILKITSQIKPFDIHKIEHIKNFNENNLKQTKEILDKYNLDEVVEYITSTGEKYKNTIKDILFHIVNHSTYHRAQIATLFRSSGITPIPTDYIIFKRLQ